MTDKTQPPAEAVKTVEITLLAPHTHKGVDCKAGERIIVRDDQAKRLIDAGRAK